MLSKTVASSDQADAYLTELLAISEAANWPWDPTCTAVDQAGFPIPASSIRIFSDSQLALLSVQSWRAGACQEVVAEILKKLWLNNVTLYWIPGHSGFIGNEKADKLAKVATRLESEEPLQRDGLPQYLVTQALKRAEIITGPLLAGRSNTGKFTRKINAALYLGKAIGLYQQLISFKATILAQLQTGKLFLKEYLHKIKVLETALCDYGLIELIQYFLFSYRRWAQQRIKLREQHGDRFRDLLYALGGYLRRQEGGRNIDGLIKRWKPDISVVKAIIEFVKETGCLYLSI